MNPGRHMAQAAMNGDAETVRALLAEAPDLVEISTSEGWTPLHLAARQGHAAVVDLLLRSGANVNALAGNSQAITPLLGAIIGVPGEVDVDQRRAVVVHLLAHGADVNLPNTAGSTPLHKAAIAGASDIVQLLLACGANVAARNSGGQTALEHAQFRGHAEVAALLAQASATSEVAVDIRCFPEQATVAK